MSAYPSFLSPIMDATNLIATTALNVDAQLALASAVVANERLDILEPIALKANLDDEIYQGLPNVDMIIDGSIQSNSLSVNFVSLAPQGSLTGSQLSLSTATEPYILSTITQVGNDLEITHTNPIGITNFLSGNVAGINELTCSTLNYTTLNPPISGSTPSIAQVLTVGEDCNLKSITNASTIDCANGFYTALDTNSHGVNIMNVSGQAYHNITANASGLDLNTKWTSDGLILHKVSTGSDITIQNDVNNLITLGTATGFADLQVGTLKYTALDPPVSGGWVGTATSNLNMTGYEITNTPRITFVNGISSGALSLLPGASTLDFDGLNITGTGSIDCNILNYTALNPPIAPSSTPTLDEVLTVSSDANQLSITNLNGITANALYIPPFGGQVGNYGILPDLVGLNINAPILTCSDIVCSGLTTGGQVSLNTLQILNGQDVVASINQAGGITSTSLTIGDNMGTYANIDTTGALVCGTVNEVSVPFKPTYDYYVSKGGNDGSIYGSILSPYLTIQQAITVCEGEQDGVPRVIHVAAGSYAENITLNKSRISIKGEGVAMHPDIGTSIYGNITINIIAGNIDMNNNNITISGFLINGKIEDSTIENRPHRLTLTNCQLYANERAIYMHPTCDYRAFINFCYISNDNAVATSPLVECGGSGMVSFNNNQITAKGASQNVFKLSDTCRIDLFAQNILTSDSVGDNLAVAIFSHASTAFISIGQNVYAYSSTSVKRNIDTASGIYLCSTGTTPTNGSALIINDVFSLRGLPSGQFAVYNVSLAGATLYGQCMTTSSALEPSAHDVSGTPATRFKLTALL